MTNTTLTEVQVEDMKHCIGMYGEKKPYKRHGRLFYRPWRNFFATGPNCDGVHIWLDLERRGYAIRKRRCNWTFELTREGLDALGLHLNVRIYDE